LDMLILKGSIFLQKNNLCYHPVLRIRDILVPTDPDPQIRTSD
jgi:hypothetical protein